MDLVHHINLTEPDFGAAPDAWPKLMPADNFNAGVMSLTPSEDIFDALMEGSKTKPLAWDADQGLLNDFFPSPAPGRIYPSRHTRMVLPVKYNLNLETLKDHREQWDDIWPDARIVHFTIAKPQSKECIPSNGCLFPQPLNAWRREFLEMKDKFGWEDLETTMNYREAHTT